MIECIVDVNPWKVYVTNMNSESGSAQRDLAILTRKSRLKRFRFSEVISLKAGLVILSLYFIYGVVVVFNPAVLELIEQVIILTILPVCLFVFFLIGRAFLLIYRQFRK